MNELDDLIRAVFLEGVDIAPAYLAQTDPECEVHQEQVIEAWRSKFLAAISSSSATETQDGERLPLVGEMLVATRIVTGSGDDIPAGWTWVDTLRPGDRVFRRAAPTPDDRDREVERIDPERLARAMSRLAEVGPPAHLNPDDAEEHWPSYLTEATDLAAEYAGLRASGGNE